MPLSSNPLSFASRSRKFFASSNVAQWRTTGIKRLKDHLLIVILAQFNLGKLQMRGQGRMKGTGTMLRHFRTLVQPLADLICEPSMCFNDVLGFISFDR